jgi:hypothetical protein
MLKLLLHALICILLPGIASAQEYGLTSKVSPTLSYQGTLSTAVTGEVTVIAKLYSDAEGATGAVWTGLYRTQVNQGLFHLPLGGGAYPFGSTALFDRQLWLGITILPESANDLSEQEQLRYSATEMRPLTMLSATPYALSVVDGAITQSKLGTDYVAKVYATNTGVSDNGIIGDTLRFIGDKGIDVYYDNEAQAIVISKLEQAESWVGQGGTNNSDRNCDNNTVIGGVANKAGSKDCTRGHHNFVGGGRDNEAGGTLFFLGLQHTDDNDFTWGSYDVIIGGDGNRVVRDQAAVYTGSDVTEGNSHETIYYASIGGGLGNKITGGWYSFMGGGTDNHIQGFSDGTLGAGDYATVLGGGTANNISGGRRMVSGTAVGASGHHGVLGGGTNNILGGEFSTIFGGEANEINFRSFWPNPGPEGAVILGGSANTNKSSFGVIGGGSSNEILWDNDDEDGMYRFIGGGEFNKLTLPRQYQTIGGGKNNRTNSNASFDYISIGGGEGNRMDEFGSSKFSTILGGSGNRVGYGSSADLVAEYSTIIGGKQLTAAGYGQTIAGRFNQNVRTPVGLYASNLSGFLSSNREKPLFIVGNGTSGAPSNAFEVSYGGKSTVFSTHGNSSTGSNPVLINSTYSDNTLAAWGSIEVSFVGGNAVVTVLDQFGVHSVTRLSTGVYEVLLRHTNPITGLPLTIPDGIVNASVIQATEHENECGWIRTSDLTTQGNYTRFLIRITYAGYASQCYERDRSFTFHVVGRPS